MYAKGRQFVIIDGAGVGIIENTANGSALQYKVQSTGLMLHDCQNCEVRNLTVSNIYQRTSTSDPNGSSYGIVLMGNSTNSSVHDCAVTNVWRAICVHYSEVKSSNVSVYNNSAIKTCIGISIGSTGAGAVAENINIYNNRVADNYVWDGIWSGTSGWWHANGMQAFASHTGSAISGLNIYNNEMGPNFGTRVTGWIYVTDAGISNVNIYNNLLTATGSSYPSNAYITLRRVTGVKVYNNTIVGSGKGFGVGLFEGASSVNIQNNIISKIYQPYTGISVNDSSSLKVSDRNDFDGPTYYYYQTKYYTLAEWQSTLGFDRNSITADPLLSSDYRPASISPVRGRGDNLGSPFNIDKAGVVRPYTGWTLGIYQ